MSDDITGRHRAQALREALEACVAFLVTVDWNDRSSEDDAGNLVEEARAALAAAEAPPAEARDAEGWTVQERVLYQQKVEAVQRAEAAEARAAQLADAGEMLWTVVANGRRLVEAV